MEQQSTGLEIAVIGLAGRFPGAPDIETFWRNLDAGVESIRSFSDEELLEAGVALEILADPAYVRARGYLDDSELFDAELFGFNAREAEILDPQQRLFLEVAWSALEHAGYGRGGERPSVGVYAGVSLNGYFLNNLQTRPEVLAAVGTMQVGTGIDKDFLATRVSYKLDLQGPSVSVQTACSTSLVAVHLACQALLCGECDIALAGGASLGVPPVSGYLYQEGGILSPDGHCRAFDADAAGCLAGHGAGAVVLKRLDDALADRDTLYAVIKGSAINNDGALKAGYTAPSVDGQAAVVRAALRVAEVEPSSIGLIEAHGTGTPLGDPIEITALRQAFEIDEQALDPGSCAIGSVKTNIGHLDAAAGIAGLIKAVQALRYRRLPPSLHFRTPNPQLQLDRSPFFVPVESAAWAAADGAGWPRRAGVSSFGIGGTNAHVILEEAPCIDAADRRETARPWQLLCLSGQRQEAIEQLCHALAAQLSETGDVPLADVAYTLHLGRRPLRHRAVVVARDIADAARVLAGDMPERLLHGTATQGRTPVAFLFSGQGTQYPGMARELYEREPVFRRHLDYCLELLQPHLDTDLRRWLLPVDSEEGQAAEALRRTELTQPALFAVEHALYELWQSWGVEPDALLGHSIGEWVAACRAGVLTLEAALEAIALRGRLVAQCPLGAMLSVPLSEAELETWLTGRNVEIAAINAPRLCAVAGPHADVEALEAELRADGVEVRRLHTSHAFHTHALQPAATALQEHLRHVELRAPHLPFVSNVTGTWITESEATDPAYWGHQLLRPVRFADGLGTLLGSSLGGGRRLLLEVGPGHTLSRLARLHPSFAEDRGGPLPVVASLPPAPRAGIATQSAKTSTEDAQASMLTALGRLWQCGVQVDWQLLYDGQARRRRPLPTYPFQHRRYWLDAAPRQEASGASATSRQPLPRWFWRPVWQQAPPATAAALPGDRPRHLVLAGEPGKARDELAGELDSQGWAVRPVASPGTRETWLHLLRQLREAEASPRRIVHLGSYGTAFDGTGTEAVSRPDFHTSFTPLLTLAQALSELGPSADSNANAANANGSEGGIDVLAVTVAAWPVTGDEHARAEEALTLGPLRTLPHEVPGIHCRAVDIEQTSARRLAAALSESLEVQPLEGMDLLALRGRRRWCWHWEPVELPGSSEARQRTEGVYLITGGLGGLGRVFAEHLLTHGATVVTIGRSTGAGEGVEALIAAGGPCWLHLTADVSDEDAMRQVFATIGERWGRLDGVIHAAGIPGEGALARISATDAEAVLAPKVRGTRVLDRLLREPASNGEPWLHQLEFFLLCGSLTGHLGGPGQVAYTAANLFLDAYAQRTALELEDLPSAPHVIAVDWDAWAEVGMAAAAVRGVASPRERSGDEKDSQRIDAHPLLQQRRIEGETVVFTSRLHASDTWVLADHRTGGRSVLPGTGYVELLRTALLLHGDEASVEVGAEGGVEISQLILLLPMAFDDAAREVRVRLRPEAGDGFSAEVASRGTSRSDTDKSWLLHAQARVTAGAGAGSTTKAEDLDSFPSRVTDEDEAGDNPLFDFGPRWRCIRQARTTLEEAEHARLRLPAEFTADLQDFPLHPALLDAAVAARPPSEALEEAAYLPFAYDRVHIHRPLTAEILSRITRHSTNPPNSAKFDVVVFDTDGRVLVEIEGYTLRRLSAEQLAVPTTQPAEEAPLAQAIRNAEGIEVLERILADQLPQRGLAQVAVSTVDFAARLARLGETRAQVEGDGTTASHARPNLSTTYVAPSSEFERHVAEVWRELLGVEELGVHDDFFELGGHSILATQSAARLREKLGTDMPLDEFFEANTIAQLAQRLLDFEAETAAEGAGARSLGDIEEGSL